MGTDDSGATDADPTGAEGDPHLVECVGEMSSSPSSSAGTPNPNNNMVLVTEREYCDGSSGCSCGGGGAGHLVSETRHVDALTWHTTDFEYDWRGRQLHVLPPADDAGRVVYTKTTYDNLDRATKQERYLQISGAADRLLARSETFHDDRSRVYQTRQYAVDVSDGTVGNALVSNTWYDAAGNTIKQQSAGSQAFTKTVYDSLGRPSNNTSATIPTRRPMPTHRASLTTRLSSKSKRLMTTRATSCKPRPASVSTTPPAPVN